MLRKLFRFLSKQSPVISTHSIKGRKDKQEDSFYVSETTNSRLLIFVADGVGGHGHGDFASQLTVRIFQDAFHAFAHQKVLHKKQIKDFLRKTTLHAAASVLNKTTENEEYKNCGTTLSGFFINQNSFYTVNIGDSRVYTLHNNILTRLTKDHSEVQRLIDLGFISEEESKTHPKKTMMTSAIGQPMEMLAIDIEGPNEIADEQILMACSDGVHDGLPDQEIEKILKQHKNKKDVAKLMVDAAYENGSKDNITACVYKHVV